MATTRKGGKSKLDESCTSLGEQAHKQIMDYLKLAENSAHPEIRNAALEIAKQTSKHERRQRARVSPTLILWVNILLALAVVVACWYAFLKYPQGLAWELSGISILIFVVLVGMSLFLTGHLSQANFMKILGWLVSHVRSRWKSVKSSLSSQKEGSSLDKNDS